MPELKKEIRCIGCNKILAEGTIKDGQIKIICKCRTVNEIKGGQKDTETALTGTIKRIV